MLAALLTSFLFATSAICGYRAAKKVGGLEANFWRIALATIILTAWACALGHPFAGAPGWFMLSGFWGIGLGDTAYFQALPKLGTRRASLITQCLNAPFAALIEWLWLGTGLNLAEVACIALTLAGVAVALAPDDHVKISPGGWKAGIFASALAALFGAFGSVLIRKGYAVTQSEGLVVDAGTTGYQRMLGGILLPAVVLLVLKWRSARLHGSVFDPQTWRVAGEKWRHTWLWVLANALAGQTLGVTCMQWALKDTQAAVVSAVIATSPLMLLPMTRLVEGEKIRPRALIGSLVAVGGVIGLTFAR